MTDTGFMRVQEIKLHDGSVYLVRRFILPRNQWFNIYLHTFLKSDDDRAYHDHPWYSVSFLIRGKLTEHVLYESKHRVRKFIPVFRTPTHRHRLELMSKKAITLFITGPRIRNWGFWCYDKTKATFVWVWYQRYFRNGGCGEWK